MHDFYRKFNSENNEDFNNRISKVMGVYLEKVAFYIIGLIANKINIILFVFFFIIKLAH